MRGRWIALIILLSVAAGAGGASCYFLNFNARFDEHALVTNTEAGIVTKIAILEHIRAGNIIEATKLLETSLDGDLISAGAFTHNGAPLSTRTRSTLAREAQARAISGYRPTDDHVNSAVEEVFRSIHETASGHDQ